jgi:choline monooxygenase
LTLDLLDRPVLVRNIDGELHAFLNVCTHRFSMLSRRPCGHFAENIKCQYHGWEYDCTGNTRKIPDAKSFKPMEKGTLGLTKFRCETAGQLVFVTLDDDAPPLAEFLGEYLFDLCGRWFSADHRLTVPLDIDHECNWKVVVENVLEGYHVESVHPKTFGFYPDEKNCRHEFHDVWDLYTDHYEHARDNRLEGFISRLAGVTPDYTWKHLLRYPNVVFGQMALFTWVQMVLPVSPSRCLGLWRIFHYPGPGDRRFSRVLSGGLRWWGRRFMTRVVMEDATIYPSIYRGIASPRRPDGGLVSIREERIFPFQRYVLKATSPETPAPDDVPEPVHNGKA